MEIKYISICKTSRPRRQRIEEQKMLKSRTRIQRKGRNRTKIRKNGSEAEKRYSYQKP
jgi:hypothetical protein